MVGLVSSAAKEAKKRQKEDEMFQIPELQRLEVPEPVYTFTPANEGISVTKKKPRQRKKSVTEPTATTPAPTTRQVLSPRQRALRNQIIMGEILQPKFKQPHEIY
ncbi:MAG: hypothetical protein ACI31C_05165 [Muribaculaceae bacterium]